MNSKQAKLLRYLVKHTRDPKAAKFIRDNWDKMSHKEKGYITLKVKQTVVQKMAIQFIGDQVAKEEAKQKLRDNLNVLSGF